jgi:two-component system, OmpR family, sensor kinase
MVLSTIDGPRRRGSGIVDQLRSVRTRIVLALVLITGVCLAGAGAVAYELECKRVERAAHAAITEEMRQFDRLMKQGIDPGTQQPFGSIAKGMYVALVSNTTVENEVVVTYANRRATYQHGEIGDLKLYELPAFRKVVRDLYFSGGTRDIDTPAGKAIVAVKPVSSGRDVGAYVVAFFVDREAEPFESAMRTYALIALGLLIVVSAASWLIAGRLLRPIRLLRETAHDISHTDLSRRIEIESKDELGQLATTFNAMLARLESSFSDQRRFLDDAGHELRTPITIVRGHLELTDPADRADVEATKALVIDELDRMARLVDDLIVLAKAERPDFVRFEVFDAGVLTDDVLDKVKAIGNRRWVLDHRGEGEVVADPQRFTQALVQLATNAVSHTSAGDEIGLGCRVEQDSVSWWIRDTGPGVPPEHAREIFERFARGPQTADMEGSGLGLSIVRAIARAHGGDAALVGPRAVRADAAPRGATFVVTIPRRGAVPESVDDHSSQVDASRDRPSTTATTPTNPASVEVP